LLGRVFGALLIIGAGVSFTRSFGAAPGAWAVLNGQYLGCVLIALAALGSGWMLTRSYAGRHEWEGSLALGLLGWGLLWWFGAGVHEIDVYAGNRDKPAWALAFFAASAAVSVGLGTRVSWRALRLTALGLLPVGMLIAALSYEWLAHAFERFTALAWLGFFTTHYMILRREEGHAPQTYAGFLHAGALWLITLLGVWELSWAAQEFIQGAVTWPLSARGVTLALPILVVLAWSRRARWPWTRWRLTYLTLGALPLLVVAGLWSLTANGSSSAAATPLDYLPLLNPLDVAQAAVLLAALGWFQVYVAARDSALSAGRQQLFWALVGAMVFVWLNAMLLRTLHHWADIPFTLRALTGSMLVQASLSIFWTVLALTVMVTATRQARRVLWLIGAALLGVVVVKLFLVDLGRTGTIARIVSFIVVGVLLLLIGYFSPVPPRQKKQEVVS
jgi:uncharacterized membrane protein